MSEALLMRAAALSAASAEHVVVTVTNLSDAGGTYLTPVVNALHNGAFDLFDIGSAASAGLERLAEDGATQPLIGEILAADAGASVAVAASGPIAPGQSVTARLTIDDAASQRFYTYASMVVPSNDAFIGNGDPVFTLFDERGRYTGGIEFVVTGQRVWDAGTEANTELEAAFINQTGPNRGTTEALGVALHEGFIGSAANPGGDPIILTGSATNALGQVIDPVAADFTRDGRTAQVASFSIVLEEQGEAGRQTLVGRSGDDLFYGGAGDDILAGGGGNDQLFGGTGNDFLNGGSGNDWLIGGFGNDEIYGGAGDDSLSGGEGNDMLYGGRGDDIVSGGNGRDQLWGGKGADLFANDGGADTVWDFSRSEGDRILLSADADLDSVLASARIRGIGVQFDLGDGASITLAGVGLGQVNADIFIVSGEVIL